MSLTEKRRAILKHIEAGHHLSYWPNSSGMGMSYHWTSPVPPEEKEWVYPQNVKWLIDQGYLRYGGSDEPNLTYRTGKLIT